ncbi:XP_029648894.2uncharacterized protein LOC115222734 [Octopus vulgaris]|uniref:XP_029648894.2uncharacterized protein LOC115222734 n=1 Tax=Octopus vulgaris TaxID=6645 RepID=A0AA36FLV2_OCTVU|nr:XP_029648894.2uncharacterized protein LOC115222734 [Octopus vulgaris]
MERYRSEKTKIQCVSKRSLFTCLILFAVFALMFTMFNLHDTDIKDLSDDDESKRSAFLVDSKFCRIPNMDPFESSLKSFFHIHKWKACPSKSLVFQDENALRVNHSVIKRWYNNTFKICHVWPIVRTIDDRHILYKKKFLEFKTDILIPHDYIKVKCFNKRNRVIFTNYHAFIQKKKTSERNHTNSSSVFKLLKTNPYSARAKVHMDVMLLGIDSVSRLNFMRQLPETRQYLLQKDAIEMNGYNKVGDNTLVNLVPLLTGKYLKDLPWNESLGMLPFDKYDFLWKKYHRNGFRTMFAEDAPVLATFNCAKYGFKVQPTDHYFRPVTLAIGRDNSVWSMKRRCVRDRSITDMVLQYTYDFVRTYNDTPHFSLSFITSLTHNDMNNAGYSDLEYQRFFHKLFKHHLIKNTFVIFFSDHGIRFGSYRSTYLGKLEERLPFMFLIPPHWFKQSFPHMWNNLKSNSHRLTTPFDIYETLVDILDMKKAMKRDHNEEIESTQRKRISLFRKVPLNRTCEEATILPHWCTCHESKPVKITDSIVAKGAQYLVKCINKKTSQLRNLCDQLELVSIKDAVIMAANTNLLRFVRNRNYVINRHVVYGNKVNTIIKDYQLTIQTNPGGGLFEGTVRYDSKTKHFSLLGDISRTNMYGDQARCVSNARKFCFCRSNTTSLSS